MGLDKFAWARCRPSFAVHVKCLAKRMQFYTANFRLTCGSLLITEPWNLLQTATVCARSVSRANVRALTRKHSSHTGRPTDRPSVRSIRFGFGCVCMVAAGTSHPGMGIVSAIKPNGRECAAQQTSVETSKRKAHHFQIELCLNESQRAVCVSAEWLPPPSCLIPELILYNIWIRIYPMRSAPTHTHTFTTRRNERTVRAHHLSMTITMSTSVAREVILNQMRFAHHSIHLQTRSTTPTTICSWRSEERKKRHSLAVGPCIWCLYFTYRNDR